MPKFCFGGDSKLISAFKINISAPKAPISTSQVIYAQELTIEKKREINQPLVKAKFSSLDLYTFSETMPGTFTSKGQIFVVRFISFEDNHLRFHYFKLKLGENMIEIVFPFKYAKNYSQATQAVILKWYDRF